MNLFTTNDNVLPLLHMLHFYHFDLDNFNKIYKKIILLPNIVYSIICVNRLYISLSLIVYLGGCES